MIDLLGFAPGWLQEYIQPLADKLSLHLLPLHIHQIIAFFLLYQLLQSVVSPLLSGCLFPNVYPTLNKRTKLNWDIHFVALIQSIIISGATLWCQLFDEARLRMSDAGRVYDYSFGCTTVSAMAMGYFIWDLVVCTRCINIYGISLFAHAACALCVSVLGMRQLYVYYSPTFLLYEISSPFLNIHWFLDKLHMTGSDFQWYNGIVLLFSFFSVRLVWGIWQTCHFVWDSIRVLKGYPGFEPLTFFPSLPLELHPYASNKPLPAWIFACFALSNVVLNILNIFWFVKMIDAVFKRFRKPVAHAVTEEKTEKKTTSRKHAKSLSQEIVLEAATMLEASEPGVEVAKDANVNPPAPAPGFRRRRG